MLGGVDEINTAAQHRKASPDGAMPQGDADARQHQKDAATPILQQLQRQGKGDIQIVQQVDAYHTQEADAPKGIQLPNAFCHWHKRISILQSGVSLFLQHTVSHLAHQGLGQLGAEFNLSGHGIFGNVAGAVIQNLLLQLFPELHKISVVDEKRAIGNRIFRYSRFAVFCRAPKSKSRRNGQKQNTCNDEKYFKIFLISSYSLSCSVSTATSY